MNYQYRNHTRDYEYGYSLAEDYISLGLLKSHAYSVVAPSNWSESKRDGFFDKVAEYRKSIE